MTVSGTVGGDAYFAPERIAEAYWKLNAERAACECIYTYPEQDAAALFAPGGAFAEAGQDAATATERVAMDFWARNGQFSR